MSEYLENVINASGGHAAPAEVLETSKKTDLVSNYFSKPATLIQENLKSLVGELGDSYAEEYVEISDITPTQEELKISKFKDAKSFDKPVIIYKDDTGMYLVDGHHRCASKVRDGFSGITAKVYKQNSVVAAAKNQTAGLEKDKDDPCWSGYVQVGMKNKNGKRVPNCVPSSASIDYIIASINESFGPSRHVSTESAYAVARQAFEKYSYLENDEDLYSAIVYDLMTYANYATTAQIDEEDDSSEFESYLPEGHPAVESSLVASVAWVAGAPDLDNSARDAVLRAFSETSDYVSSLHASTRLRAVVSSGNVSEATLLQIKTLSERHSKVI